MSISCLILVAKGRLIFAAIANFRPETGYVCSFITVLKPLVDFCSFHLLGNIICNAMSIETTVCVGFGGGERREQAFVTVKSMKKRFVGGRF